MVWRLIALVIAPLLIVQAYRVMPAGPLAWLPAELGHTDTGLGVIGAVG
jgi:hypothetical protein